MRKCRPRSSRNWQQRSGRGKRKSKCFHALQWKDVGRSLAIVSQRFVRFLLLFAALWLPVQTMAAMSMPLCRHALEQAAAAAAAEASAASMPCHEAVKADPAAHDAGCDNCASCHLACAGFMPSAPLATTLIAAEYDYVLPALKPPQSHITEPPQHPPRGSA